MKKLLFVVFALVFALPVFAAEADVVKLLLPDSDLKPVVLKLSAENIAAVQSELGSNVQVRGEYSIYKSKTGIVVIEEQMGKWSLIKLAVLIDPSSKTVKKVELISMNEKRGQGIKGGTFINQFNGKTKADFSELGKGIRAVSGATVSSRAVFIAVKRALKVYELSAAGLK